jgi:hypothetical protein
MCQPDASCVGTMVTKPVCEVPPEKKKVFRIFPQFCDFFGKFVVGLSDL